MAIDGIKIIDSDIAHDVYNEFVDLYDADMEIADIKSKIEVWRNAELDLIEYEIFITAYALALWETGYLTADVISEIAQILANGESIKKWVELTGDQDGKAREKELYKLINKISVKKTNPRKRKKYSKVSRFLFKEDDIVAFQMPDKSYRAAIMFGIDQYRGNCNYWFTPTNYAQTNLPVKGEIIAGSVLFIK